MVCEKASTEWEAGKLKIRNGKVTNWYHRNIGNEMAPAGDIWCEDYRVIDSGKAQENPDHIKYLGGGMRLLQRVKKEMQ